MHQIDHPMLKIRSPIQNRPCHQNRKPGHPSAGFVEDVTLRDGISCYPGVLVKKTWALKNNGKSRWPQGVQLLFLSGDLAPERLIEVPCVEPGATVQVSAMIKLPVSPKQYTGYYRLATADGKKFGPRIWIDVIVVGQEPEIPDAKADVSHLDGTDIPIQIISSPASDIPQLEDIQADVKQEPKVEKQDVQGDAKAEINVMKSEKPQLDVKEQDTKQKPQVPTVQSPYASQLQTLESMGFQDTELNSYLLSDKEGNVERVIEWLLSHTIN